jgi:TonB family protein
MKPMAAIFHPLARGSAIPEEAAFWGAGLVFTFLLFFALAHFENVGGQERAIEIEDMPVVSIPLEPPPSPPKVTEAARAPGELMPLAGIEVEASDSPVKVAVVPPDMEALIPNARIPPQAMVDLGFHAKFSPTAGVDFDFHRVYQQTEVDQRPHAVIRVAPHVPTELFGTASMLRVTLLLVIDTDGRAASTQIMKSSGKPVFDSLVAQTVKEQWLFSPAIRRGKKVKCLAEQAIRITLPGGSPFDVQ